MSELLVRDLMTREVVTVLRGARLAEVHALMEGGRFRHVPVVDDEGRLVGLLSDRDLSRIAGDVDHPHRIEILSARFAGHVMTTPVDTIGPDEPIEEAAERLRECRYGCLPVAEEGRLIGIITKFDFVRRLSGIGG